MEKRNRTCNHIGLFADNPERLLRFYVEKIGFERREKRLLSAEMTQQIFGFNEPCNMTKLVFGSVVLEVFSLENKVLEERYPATRGYNHWGLAVKNRDSFIHDLEEKGIPIIRVERGERVVFFIKDPEDNLIEIFEA